jgi:hypothetical protein
MRWARFSLCALVVSVAVPVTTVPAGAAVHRETATARSATPGPALTLRAQTPWITPTAPWFTLSLGVGNNVGAVSDLHVEVTFYSRINDATHMAQATNGSPAENVLTHFDEPVTMTAEGLGVVTCAVVLPDDTEAPTPAAGTAGVCPAGDTQTVPLPCHPDEGTCGDVYPVSVNLYHQGQSAPLARFTTFMSYQEPEYSSSIGAGGSLRVGVIVPVSSRPSTTLSPPSAGDRRAAESVVGQIWANRTIPMTVAADPSTVSDLAAVGGKKGIRAVKELDALPADRNQLLSQPFVPIDLAALVGARLTDEIGLQFDRGSDLLRLNGLHPTTGTWVNTSTPVTGSSADNLATGLKAAHADHLILDDSDLTPPETNKLTFAQPFTLALGSSTHVAAAGADSQLDAFFTARPGDPVLAANQLLATMEFLHFENAFATDSRGVILEPPTFWRPPPGFLAVLFHGLDGNPALSPVDLNQFFAQVPVGGNGEPKTRHLKAGTPTRGRGLTTTLAHHLGTARVELTSFSRAASDHPAVFGTLADLLLRTESQTFDRAQRTAALGYYLHQFDGVVNLVTLAAQSTITFTSRTAAIPVSVLSSAPFQVKVVVSLQSDKFTFPDGAHRTVLLQRPTTPVRVQARSRTSGDHLPVQITLSTPDGGLVIARTSLSVRSTSISLVGVALTLLAALVLLVWWFRTWRRGRRARPRAA